ncbi:hypothetical protein COO60DRAFT_1646873 [Scenedesmus sp. NREL 46B-D3]|nr:hypothetical protein COO60DRAFT_1646873 [Scenedesmus sp. NREL 46B-D3]
MPSVVLSNAYAARDLQPSAYEVAGERFYVLKWQQRGSDGGVHVALLHFPENTNTHRHVMVYEADGALGRIVISTGGIADESRELYHILLATIVCIARQLNPNTFNFMQTPVVAANNFMRQQRLGQLYNELQPPGAQPRMFRELKDDIFLNAVEHNFALRTPADRRSNAWHQLSHAQRAHIHTTRLENLRRRRRRNHLTAAEYLELVSLPRLPLGSAPTLAERLYNNRHKRPARPEDLVPPELRLPPL